MISLPLLNVRLRACSEDWQQMMPTAQGHHCAHCNRTVLDFTQATQTDLEAAFQASPDGRVCGQFSAAQLAPDQPAPLPRRVALRPKLRRFLVALVLVCGLGMGAQQAVAQVRQAAKTTPQTAPAATIPYYGGVEQMPVYKGGQEALLKFIGANINWPAEAPLTIDGRVFVQFQITETGAVRDVRVAKGLHPALDAEALRVIRLLDGNFTPGSQNNRPVSTGFIVPITFRGTDAPPATRKRK